MVALTGIERFMRQFRGSLYRAPPGTMRTLIDHVNRELAQYVRSSGNVLLDVANLAQTVGLAD